MSELIVVEFPHDRDRAAAVLSELRMRDEAWTPNLPSAVAVYRNARGELKVDESYESTKGNGAISGGLVGLMIGLVLAVMMLPLTTHASASLIVFTLAAAASCGAVIGARWGAADVSWWKAGLGVPDAFQQQLDTTIQQSDSAIAVVLHHPGPDDLAEHFRRYGGSVLRTPLNTTVRHPFV